MLLTSLSEAVPDERLAGLTAPHRAGARGFLGDLAAALDGWQVVVVLENLHEVVDPALLTDLDLWLGLVPTTTKVVLTSRSDPPLMSLQGRKLRGAIDQLRASDLAFTPDELRMLAPEVEPDTRRSMWRRTEGWPALVRLMLMAVRAAGDEASLPTGEDPVLAEYLFTELFRKQDEQIQSLMLVCGTLETIPLDLVASITGMDDAGRVLEELVTTSGLVTRVASPTGGRAWYRFHPLLRAYLRGSCSARTGSGTPRSTPRRPSGSSRWASTPRRSATPAPAPTRRSARGVVADVGIAMVNAGEASLLLSALGDARSRRLATSPWTHVVAAAALLDLGRVPEAVGELHLVREPARGRRTTSGPPARRSSWVCAGARANGSTRACPRRQHGRPGRADVLAEPARHGDGVGGQARGAPSSCWPRPTELAQGLARDAVLIDSLTMMASAETARSQFGVVDGYLDRAFETARHHGWGASPRLAYAHLLSAWSCRQRLDDDGARRHVALARALVHPAADPTVLGSVRALDGALRFEADPSQVEEVEQMHEVWQSFASAQVAPAWMVGAALLHARLSLRLHRANRVRESIEDVRRLLGECGELHLLEAMLEAANGHHRRALELVRGVTSGQVDVVVPMSLVDAWAQEAALQTELGDSFAATAAARPALDLAVELGALRPLLDSGGDQLIGLLQRERGRWGNHEPLVEQLIRVARQPDAAAPVLTDRELEVLVELPTLRTVDEIAHSMYVSVNTVKTHLRNVYRKLGVTSRREAVEAARMRGLL